MSPDFLCNLESNLFLLSKRTCKLQAKPTFFGNPSKELLISELESMEHKNFSIPCARSCCCNLSSVYIYTCSDLLAILPVSVSYFSSAISIFSGFKIPLLHIFCLKASLLIQNGFLFFFYITSNATASKWGQNKWLLYTNSRYIFTRINRA